MDKFLSKEGLIHLWAQITSKLNEKQPKNLIVEYIDNKQMYVTSTSNEVCDAADAGIEVKFFDGLEYLNLLEYSKEQHFAVFYTDYYDSANILNVKYVAISGNSIMMADTQKFNVAYKEDVNKKQDKITGSNGQYVKFVSGKLVGADLDLTEAKEYTDNAIANINIPTAEQSDWQESDENSPAFIKNRTHWVENSNVLVLPETTYETHRAGYVGFTDFNNTLLENSECIVTLNGTEYRTQVRHGKFNAYEWWVLGNGDLISEDSIDIDLPFAIFLDGEDDYLEYDPALGTTITLKIECIGEYVHKIPDIYLPDRIGAFGTGGYAEIFNDLENNIASNDYAHAHNFRTTASGYASHAEGIRTTASGYGSHSEGIDTVAKGPYSHAEGWYTEAAGSASHASGLGTYAAGANQFVAGSYNVSDKSSLMIIGKGTSETARSDAFMIDSSGNGWFSGTIKLGKDNNTVFTNADILTDSEIDEICDVL